MKAARLGIEEVTISCSDMISHLPDDLLFRILSLIPVSDAMSTSLLSKRWKSVWKMMPTLEYNEYSFPNIGSLGFDQFCGRSLQLHQAPVLKTLDLILDKHSNDLDSLLFQNIHSTLLEITITSPFYPCYHSTAISFPTNLKVFQTLVVLKLYGRIFLDVVDSPVCFQSLKSLHIKCVKFACEESFCTFLSACPVLEDLFFERPSNIGLFLFSISVPSLQRLFITAEPSLCARDDLRLEIDTPFLKYLKIKDHRVSLTLAKDMPKLVKANVRVNLSKTEKLLKVITSVEHLLLDLYPSMVFHLTDRFICNRLLHLELYIYYNFRSNLLLHLLKDLPNLRALKLNHTHPNYGIIDQLCSVSEPSSVPECLSFHLETLQWIGYGGTHEEKETAVYILKNALRLKNATISIHSTSMKNDMIMMKELESMYKASTSCKLVIQLPNFS